MQRIRIPHSTPWSHGPWKGFLRALPSAALRYPYAPADCNHDGKLLYYELASPLAGPSI